MNFRLATVADGEQLAQMRWDMRARTTTNSSAVSSRVREETGAFLREGIESVVGSGGSLKTRAFSQR